MSQPTQYPPQGQQWPPPAPAPRNGLGTAAMVLGILALLFSLIPFIGVIAWPLLILGLAFAVAGFARVRKGTADNRGAVITGAVTSVLALIVCIVWLNATAAAFDEVDQAAASGPVIPTLGAEPSEIEFPTMQPIDPAPEVFEDPPAPAAPPAPAEPELTIGQQNAVEKADSYLSFTAFSRSGLIDQLEFEGFPAADAEFAVDRLNPDWMEQAAKKAQSYLDFTSFSRSGMVGQLEFDGFTTEQAEHGANAAGL